MARFSQLSAALLLSGGALSAAKTLKSRIPQAFKAASPDVSVDSYLSLSKSKSRRRANPLASISSTNYTTPLNNTELEEYTTTIQWAGESYAVIVDTGSSDTWLVQAGFQCVDCYGDAQPEADCYFGPTFNGTFEDGEISNENFNISYGDGEFLTGTMGYEDVTVAGVTVPKQEVALVDYCYWFGDEVTSGLMGLAYPLLTSAYEGTDPAYDNENASQVEYSPVFTTMYNDGLVNPVFSLVLDRESDAGTLALGGLPPDADSLIDNSTWGSTPITMLDLYDIDYEYPEKAYYTIVADSYIWGGESGNSSNGVKLGLAGLFHELETAQERTDTQFPIIIDSGTTLVYLPTAIAESYYEMFDPPAEYVEDEGAYFASCDADAPAFAVVIGGQAFDISAADLLWQDYAIDGGLCLVGIVDGGDEGGYILGDVFMNNVLSVFDVGASEMRFAQRVPY
ncbi:acid protease [Xylariaceae sp. FL0804]|nr:acid protease [Xylariaceae sp. FL0804]